MKLREYLFLKRNWIIGFFLIHGFALFVNINDIEGEFDERTCRNFVDGTDNQYLFTSFDNVNTKTSHFWPFVDFFEDSSCRTVLMGIFRYYDSSEFIAYSLLFIIFIFLKWSNKKK